MSHTLHGWLRRRRCICTTPTYQMLHLHLQHSASRVCRLIVG